MKDTFDAHAWIRDFGAAGGTFRLAAGTWGSTAPSIGDQAFFDTMARLYGEIAGDEPQAIERRGAIYRALRWRARP